MKGCDMSYVEPDYKHKKQFVEAVNNGVKHRPFSPSGFFAPPQNGTDVIEGPHAPAPHQWYASVVIENGFVTKVK